MCVWEGKNKWDEIYTSLLATQVCFAHLLRSQGDKVTRKTINSRKDYRKCICACALLAGRLGIAFVYTFFYLDLYCKIPD